VEPSDYVPLPDACTALFDKIEEARWHSLEEVDIAISDALVAASLLDVSPGERERTTAVLLLLRCMNTLRRVSRLEQREQLIVDDARDRLGGDPIVESLLWIIDNAFNTSFEVAEEHLTRGDAAASLGAFWLSDQLYENAMRAATSVNKLDVAKEWLATLQTKSSSDRLQKLLPLPVYYQRMATESTDPAFQQEMNDSAEAAKDIPRLRGMLYVARAYLAGHLGEEDLRNTMMARMVAEAEAYGSNGWLLTTLNNAANLARGYGDQLGAIRYGQQARTLARENDLKRDWAIIDHALTWSYDGVGLPEIAVTIGREGLDLSIELGMTGMTFNLYLILGKVLSRLDQIDDALEMFDRAADISDQVQGVEVPRAAVLTFRGHALTRCDRAEEALPHLMEALDICQQRIRKFETPSGDFVLQMANVQWALARAHHLLDEFDKALPYYETLRSREQMFVNSDEGVDIHRHLAECYTAIGDDTRALASYQRYIEAHQAFSSGEQQQRIVRQEVERSVEAERARAERERKLLHAILPSTIADRRLNGERRIADTLNDVVVMFIDVAGFTPKAEQLSAHQLIRYLESIFEPIEEIVTKHGGEKIKTIGDAFMAACGATSNTDRRAERMVRAALEIADLHGTDIRIGINSGQVVAGVLGEGRFTFDLWGDAVNTAARMEEYSEPGRVHVTEAIARQVDGITDLHVESRGIIDVKGKGLMQTYWVTHA